MFCFPLSSLHGVYGEPHHWGESVIPVHFPKEAFGESVCRLPSGSGLARALLRVFKIASDCTGELWWVRGTSARAGGSHGVEEGGRSRVNRWPPGAAVTLRMLHWAGGSASQAERV